MTEQATVDAENNHDEIAHIHFLVDSYEPRTMYFEVDAAHRTSS